MQDSSGHLPSRTVLPSWGEGRRPQQKPWQLMRLDGHVLTTAGEVQVVPLVSTRRRHSPDPPSRWCEAAIPQPWNLGCDSLVLFPPPSPNQGAKLNDMRTHYTNLSTSVRASRCRWRQTRGEGQRGKSSRCLRTCSLDLAGNLSTEVEPICGPLVYSVRPQGPV